MNPLHLVRWMTLALAGACVSCQQAAPPEPVLPTPTPEQVVWHQLETYAFVHIGLKTFDDQDLGYGDTPATLFAATHLDCEQWVRTLQAAGLKGVILTTKHHDGFCLWQTATTDYSVQSSPWKEGKGDVVRELSEACQKYGLKFGVYLSPWDRHSATYGEAAYVEQFHAQLHELITNYGPLFECWFDGMRNGEGWYGGARERRTVPSLHYYDFDRVRDSIKAHHPGAMIFGGTAPDIRWIGNEQGRAGDTQWSIFWPVSERPWPAFKQSLYGDEQGRLWLGGECDVSIRPGWFYADREDHQLKTVQELREIYYRTVGHNATLLLNFPVNREGRISSSDSLRAVEWRQTIQQELRENLLEGSYVESSNDRGRGYQAKNTLDGDWNSYWATEDGVTAGTLTFTLDQAKEVNRLLLQEYIPLGQRVRRFEIDLGLNGRWTPVETADSLTTVGYKRIVRFRTQRADKIRVRFADARGPLCINQVAAYLAPVFMTEPTIHRGLDDKIRITAGDSEAKIYYTLDGSTPTSASTSFTDVPFDFPHKGTVKAIAYDPLTGLNSPMAIRTFDLPASDYEVLVPQDEKSRLILDGDGFTTLKLSKQQPELVVRLKSPQRINGFRYMPDQRRDVTGHITRYQLFIDGRQVTEGEFSTIKTHPIEQLVTFPPTMGREVRLVVLSFVKDRSDAPTIAEFSLITEDE